MTTLRASALAVPACTVAGLAFVVDTVTIAVLDRSFDPLDSILFFCGLLAMVVGVAAAGLVLSAGRRPRWLWAVGIVVVVGAVLGVVSGVGDYVARSTYTGDNLGLRTEWSFFLIGLQLLVLGAGVARRPAPRGVTASLTRRQNA